MRFVLFLLLSLNLSYAAPSCFKIVGHVIESTEEYTDIAYREKSLRLYYKVAARKNLLPRGITLQAYIEKSKDSKYVSDYNAVDITRRSVASSSEVFSAVELTKDGKCLRDFK